jgi:hypothetical protein
VKQRRAETPDPSKMSRGSRLPRIVLRAELPLMYRRGGDQKIMEKKRQIARLDPLAGQPYHLCGVSEGNPGYQRRTHQSPYYHDREKQSQEVSPPEDIPWWEKHMPEARALTGWYRRLKRMIR